MSNVSFSPQELADLKTVYELFDVSGRGGIETRELRKALRLLGFKVSRQKVQQMISDVQLPVTENAKGLTDYSAFVQIVSNLQGSSYDKHGEIVQAFDYLDADGDGQLSAGDLKKSSAIVNIGLSPADVEGMIAEADRDGDGMISKQEFISVMMKTNLFK